jgi:hypothetical protein
MLHEEYMTMAKHNIRGLIKCVIFGVAAGLLCEAIRRIVDHIIWEFLWEFLKDYWGTPSGVGGWGHDFYWLLPQIFVPGLVLVAPIAFSLEGLFVAPLESKRRYWVVFVAPLVYIGLASIILSVYEIVIESGLSFTSRDWIIMIRLLPLLLLFPFRAGGALSVFGFWLPSIATGLYCHLSRKPRWWLSGLIGLLTLIAGVQFWTLMCVLTGAETA